jgi:hypothetical protein
MDITDWCINQLVRSVLSFIELVLIDQLMENFLVPLIIAQGHLGAMITSNPISKCNNWSKIIQP